LEISRFIASQVELTQNTSEYIMRIIENSRPRHPVRKSATRTLQEYVDRYIEDGGGLSPRTNYHFEALARTRAFMNGRSYVSVDDVRKVAKLVISHKLRLSYQAVADRVTPEAIVKAILDNTEVPPK
jgi:MoxR-like ATPase